MNIDKIPVIGKVHKTLNIFVVNFVLLAVVCLILGIVIPFYPQVLDFLASAFLIVSGIILLNLAYHINSSKKKYFDWLEK